MAKNKKSIVEYHPEFLYFNDFVRRNNYNPKDHKWVWKSETGEGMPPYEAFEWILDNIHLQKGHKQIHQLISGLVNKGLLLGVDKNLDIKPWLDFAYSLNIEDKVARYSKVIFDLFQTHFDLPPIKVSPIRLMPHAKKLYNTILSGGYSTETMLRADPAFFSPDNHMIFIPLPESERKLPLGLYDEIVAHEFLHVPTRILDSVLFITEFSSEISEPPSLLAFCVFSELLANIGSFKVLKKSNLISNNDLNNIGKKIITERAIAQSEVCTQAALIMASIPFEKWCDLLRPVFTIYRELEFIGQEQKRISSLTTKQLEGILRKKYAYKKSIKGKSINAMKQEVANRSVSRWKIIISRVKELDLIRLLKAAHAQTTSHHDKVAYESLIDIFSNIEHSESPIWKRRKEIAHV